MNTKTIETPTTPSMRLDGLCAVVTGAGRGLGRASALALAEAGADVVLISRTPAELEEVATRIGEIGPSAQVIACDITEPDAVNAALSKPERVNILVNNAGTNVPEPFVEVSQAHYDRIMDLNVKALFMASQAAARRMIEARRGGSIINMSSQMGHVGAPTRTVYCASKHAVEGLTKAMAVELAPHKIRVNSISPTFILTPMTQPYFENQAFREETLSRIPLGELGELKDVMGSVVFLASAAAALITGASLVVDGGWTAW